MRRVLTVELDDEGTVHLTMGDGSVTRIPKEEHGNFSNGVLAYIREVFRMYKIRD